MPYQKRRKRLKALIGHADGMLISNETNVRYLTGFTGDSSYLIVKPNGEDILVSDPRYEEQIAEECPGLATAIRKPSELTLPLVCQQIDGMDIQQLIVEGNSMTISTFEILQTQTQVEGYITGSGEVEQLRAIKDAGEIATLRKAVEIAERTFRAFREQLMPGQSELELAHEIERIIRRLGGTGCAFEPIVAVGARAALPHAVPGQNRLERSPLLLVDWGAKYSGYRSDLTRVLVNRKLPAKIGRAYEAVQEAQAAAIDAMKPGVMVSEIDKVARDVIARHKMAKRFNHGLGHGIGLDIHESPFLGKNSDQPLKAGMVITVEPGVYFPGLGGIRLEDDVLITDEGAQRLSTLPLDIEDNVIDLLR